jgi:hypothetical protein
VVIVALMGACRFIVDTSQVQLSLYVAPVGYELKRYPDVLLEGWSGE